MMKKLILFISLMLLSFVSPASAKDSVQQVFTGSLPGQVSLWQDSVYCTTDQSLLKLSGTALKTVFSSKSPIYWTGFGENRIAISTNGKVVFISREGKVISSFTPGFNASPILLDNDRKVLLSDYDTGYFRLYAANGQLLQDRDDEIECIDISKGTSLWKKKNLNTYWVGGILAKSTKFFAFQTHDLVLHIMDENGNQIWGKNIGEIDGLFVEGNIVLYKKAATNMYTVLKIVSG